MLAHSKFFLPIRVLASASSALINTDVRQLDHFKLLRAWIMGLGCLCVPGASRAVRWWNALRMGTLGDRGVWQLQGPLGLEALCDLRFQACRAQIQGTGETGNRGPLSLEVSRVSFEDQ